MAKIAKNIADGAMAFLKAEYKILSVFVIITAVLLAFKGINEGSSWLVAVSFVVGALCSGLSRLYWYAGLQLRQMLGQLMLLNILLEKHLEIAFSGGSVMGMGVVGLGVLRCWLTVYNL